MTGRGPRRAGLTVIEVVLGALLVGCVAVPILELIRMNTVSLEITAVETLARGLGADVLERLAERADLPGREIPETAAKMQGAPRRWDEVIDEDPSLKRSFPKPELAQLLNLAEVRIAVVRESPVKVPAGTKGPGLDWYEVTVSWKAHDGLRKEVSYGRFVEP